MLEIEMKFPVSDFAEIRRKLRSWGARSDDPIEEADHYFNAPDRDFARTDEAVRLRRIGAHGIGTYKGPKEAGPTKTRLKIEVPLAPGAEAADKFCRFITSLRYRPVAVVQKTRSESHFERDGFEMQACLDEVVGLGRFVEIEIVAPLADRDRAQKTLLSATAELGLAKSERRSYLELQLAKNEPDGGK